MDIFQALILAVVEGITEFLPVSSTGHMVLASEFFNIPQTEFVKNFEIIIQVGAILAIVFLYGKRLLKARTLWLKLLVAFVPTAVIGLALYSVIKTYLLGNTQVTLWALLIGGIVLIVWEKFYKEKPHHLDKVEDLSYKKAFLVGLCQSISIIPGVSRSASTILGGMALGLNRKASVELSFLLAVPTLAAASGLDLVKSNFAFSPNEWMLLGVGLIGSFITAVLAVKFFVRYVADHTFVAFGVYRIVVAIIFWLFIVQ